jgi:uncharacterized protein
MQPSIKHNLGDAPDSRRLRIVPLDAIRGIAVMGILAMNILAFAMPFPAYVNPTSYGGSTGADFWAWLITFIAVDGKMRGLFSLLFGASMWLVIDGAEAKGESGAATHYWRMVFLLIFGLIHCYLIWMGDILALYALCGMMAYFFVRWPPRKLIITALVMFTIQFLLWTIGGASIHALEFAAAQPNAPADVVQAYKEMAPALMGPDSPAIAEELRAFTGSYGDALAIRTSGEYALGPLAMFIQFGLETIALMLVGAALLKNGLFAGDWDAVRERALALKFGIPALIGLGIAAYIIIASGFATVPTFAISFIWTMPLDWMLTIAYAALLVHWVKPRVGSGLVGRLAAAGKAAFTNYLGTSIVMTTLFYGYGFGLFGSLGRAECYLVVVVMCGVMLLWSKLWMDRFQYGPLEWLWRSLSRRSLQPMA